MYYSWSLAYRRSSRARPTSGTPQGLLAAGTAVTTAGIASAGTTAARHQPSCGGGNFFHVTKSHVNYFLGTPNNT